ncbi:baseplate J/gp47 family protein [Xanthobacter autotrophicus]|uniref:baseplate J/gp47 family protein n=1 Tax=Xanthobacter TaxID=279 RepID=UPI0024AC4D56|nr:baseplate J/gp47 family protein [Xanthobacter autotrophicus]MDI4664723.1 baseplate J/gp47 family protein [Xanthobacter autotrophicus]
MPFPLPTPDDIARQMEASAEASLRKARPDADPRAIARAVRSSRGYVAAIIRATVLTVYTCHLHLRWWGDQYFPDTAELEQLLRHADIWGVTQRPATKAIGRAEVTGAPDVTIPALTRLQGAGTVIYEVVSAATVDAGGTAVLDIRAVDAGVSGNAPAGLVLTILDTVAGLTAQVATVDADGIVGGAPIETAASLLARLLAEIREPAHGGARFDYPRWIQNDFAASQVVCLPNWVGLGTVGVVVAMGTAAVPRPPIAAELDAMLAHIQGLRPVTADAYLLACELLPQPMTLAVDPYEARVRQAVDAAAAAFFAREATIGGRLYRSRLGEAISAAAGEYRHEMTVPAADIVPGPLQLPIPGAITWNVPT